MRSGNVSSFKQMGSSPAKQTKAVKNFFKEGGREPATKAVENILKEKGLTDNIGLDKKSKAVKKFFEDKKTVTKKEFEKALKRQDKKRFTSPAKQKDFNKTGSKASTTPGYSTTKAANKGLPKNFNATGSSKAGKFAKVAKKVVGKGGKFLGGKLLGVAGMLMATSSKADQPTKGKGKTEYPGGKIDFTKKK